MARYVVTQTTTVAGSGYSQPARTVTKGQVLDLSAAEVTAIGGGNLRAVSAPNGASPTRDALGESFAASN
jgi:hypothetical protein